MENINFEWDEQKNTINKRKHGLSFETAREMGSVPKDLNNRVECDIVKMR